VLAALATTATACTEDRAAPTEARGRIAFLATMGEDRATELRVVDVQDGGTRLAVAADSTNAPHWSPDGSRLVFVGRLQGRVGLMLARTDGAKWQTEWLERRSGWNPVFSPDGGSIAFSSDRDGNWEIYIMDLGTRVVRRLTDGPESARHPAWSPDGQRIAFRSSSGPTAAPAALWLIGADGSGRRKVADNAVSRPTWSPAGRHIAFVAAGPTLTVVDVDSGAVRRIADHAGEPAWSPDSARLAFEGSGRKPAQIVAVGADGSGFTDLSHNGRFNRDPAWSKDGNWIAFVSGGCQSPFLPCLEANHEVYVMRKEGSGAVKLTHGVKWAAFPEWSP